MIKRVQPGGLFKLLTPNRYQANPIAIGSQNQRLDSKLVLPFKKTLTNTKPIGLKTVLFLCVSYIITKKMNKQFFSTLVMAIAIFATASAQKINIAKGQKMENLVVLKMKMNVDLGGQQLENDAENKTTSVIEVKEASDKGYTLSSTLKRATFNMSAMGMERSFDSDKPEDLDGEMGGPFKDKINKSTDIQIGKDGKIIEYAEDDKTDGPSSMIGINALAKGQTYPLLLSLPAKALKVGDVWTDSSGTAETVKRVVYYTLKEIKGDDLIVTFTGNMAKKGVMEQMGMELNMDIAGDMTGEATYEKSSGWLKSNNMLVDVKGTMEIMGQSGPITIKMDVATTNKKL